MNARKIWFALSLWLLLLSGWLDPAAQSLQAQTSQGPVGSRSLNASSTAKLPTLRYVQVTEASVYAGPSEDYYPTSILKRGDAVEVYDQTHDGWLAIRPPSGSFSWLPAAQGLLLPGGRVVEVTDKSAVSWIGSTLGSAKQYRWQVQLNRGEQLAVLGEQSMQDASSDAKTLWYKITPPSGEYRWIPLKATSDQAPDAIERRTGQVMLASNEEPTDDQLVDDSIIESESFNEQGEPGLDRRAPSRAGRTRNQGRPVTHPTAEDRWASWHAVEFKDGSFSFPGVARMLGITPAPTNRSASSYDPFDLTANTRPRSASSSTAPNAALASTDSSGAGLTDNESTGTASQMAVRQSRGWRDPRELREARLQGGIRAGVEDNGDAINALVDTNDMGDRDADDQAVTSANYVSDDEIGSSVVAASAQRPDEAFRSRNASSSSSMLAAQGSTDEDGWYGIRQAPNSVPYKPMSLNNADLSEVQFQLSQMVTGPEYTWNLAPLADRTRTLIEHGVTAIERGEARLLMERIEQFAALAKRATELGMSAPAEPSPQLPLGTQSSLGANTGVAFNASPLSAAASRWVTPLGFNNVQDSGPTGPAAQFDATGWIVPVLGSSRDMPTHALTNDAGKIIVYLTPAAGVNLSRYSSQPIGVYGLRGYLPQLKTNHIQVQRVVRLQ